MRPASPLRLPAIELKAPTPDDAAVLSRLACDTFIETFGHLYAPEDLESFLNETYSPRRIAEEIGERGSLHLIAWYGGEAIGFAKARESALPLAPLGARAMELQRLYVLAEHRDKGVGKALMDAVVGGMHARGVSEICLSVWEDNAPARRFYRAHGFEDAGQGEFRVGRQIDREVLMRRVA